MNAMPKDMADNQLSELAKHYSELGGSRKPD
jgi:hypothetical protein